MKRRITISLGSHSFYICPEDFLKEIADISREFGLKIHVSFKRSVAGKEQSP